MDEQRFYLDSDDSGHWYCVPAEDETLFDELLETIEGDGDESDEACNKFEEHFAHCRIDHPNGYTFTNWREK